MRLIRIKKADIPKNERAIFERYGEFVIGSVLASGYHPGASEISHVYDAGHPMQLHAVDWLTEQFHRKERREDWNLLMEIAITALVSGELLFSFLDWLRPR